MDNYDLNPAQRVIVDAMASMDPERPRIYLWSGSVRSGKTWGAALGLSLAVIRRGRGGQFIVVGRSVGALERNVLPSIFEHLDNFGVPYRYVRSRQALHAGESVIHLFGGYDQRAEGVIQGITAAGVLIDEAALLPQNVVNQALARASEPLARIIMTCNPSSPSHWLKREYFDKADEIGAVTLHSGLSDNPSLTDGVLRFYDQAFTGHYKRRMVDGDWVGATGLVYPRYERYIGGALQTENRFSLFDVGLDWGAASPTAGVLFVRDGLTWIAADEYYWRGGERGERTVAEHASAIEAFGDNWGRFDRTLIDPSAAALRVELGKRGIRATRGNNDRERGIQALSTALALGRVVVDEERCPEFTRELQTLEWDERASERGEDDVLATADDHACDAARYWCMNRLPPQISLLPERLPVGF